MRTVGLVENDATFAATLRTAVEANGFRVVCMPNGNSAAPFLDRHSFALLIVDAGVRDVDPFALLHAASAHQPVIALTDDPTDEECVRALHAGADDCLRRPLAPRELLVRMRNVMRRVDTPDDVLSQAVDAMRVHGHDLTRGEAEVLAVLLEHAPAPMTIDQIAALLPGVKRDTIASRIKTLRRKMGSMLVSRGRFGYEVTR
jgi:DNA-binding response OmpR family regulator